MSSSIARAYSRVAALQHALRVADLFLHLVVADAAGRLLQLARRVALVLRACRWRASGAAARGPRASASIASFCSPSFCACASCACAAGLRSASTPLGDLLLLVGELLRPGAARSGCRARPLRAALLELLLRFAQPLLGRRGLRAAVARAVGRRAAHRVGRVLQPLRRRRSDPRAGCSRDQLLELPRRLLHLVGERALARRRRPPRCDPTAPSAAAARPPAAGAARAPSASRPARRSAGRRSAARRAAASRTGSPACPARARTDPPDRRPSARPGRRRRRRRAAR